MNKSENTELVDDSEDVLKSFGLVEKVKEDPLLKEFGLDKPPPVKSLTELMEPKDDSVVDAVIAPYRKNFELRGKKADKTDSEFFNNRKELDDADNRLLDSVDNISKKYNIKRGDLLEYALADGWIPKNKTGVSQFATGVASDVVANVDTLAERKIQDKIFKPEAIQAIVETRRAVQDSMGAGRMVAGMAGETVAGIVGGLATGGATLPLTLGATASGLAQGAISGSAQGAAYSDTSAAIRDEEFDNKQKKQAEEQLENKSFVPRVATKAFEGAINKLGEAYDSSIAQLPGYAEWAKENPQLAAGTRGGFVGGGVGGVIGGGVGGILSGAKIATKKIGDQNIKLKLQRSIEPSNLADELVKEIPNEIQHEIKNVGEFENLSPNAKKFVSENVETESYPQLHTEIRQIDQAENDLVSFVSNQPVDVRNADMQTEGIGAIFNSVVTSPDGVASETTLKTRSLIDELTKSLNNGLDVRGKKTADLLNGYITRARQPKESATGVDFSPFVKQIETILTLGPEVLNNVDTVSKYLGEDATGSRSPFLSQFKADTADKSFNFWYQQELLESLKAAHIDPKTDKAVIEYVNKYDALPSEQMLTLANYAERDIFKNNEVDSLATLADKEALNPSDTIGALNKFEEDLTALQFDKGHTQIEVRNASNPLKEKLAEARVLDKELSETEKELNKTLTELNSKGSKLEDFLQDAVFDNRDEDMGAARFDVLDAIRNETEIPESAIDIIASLNSVHRGQVPIAVNTLVGELREYNGLHKRSAKWNDKFSVAFDQVNEMRKTLDTFPELRDAKFDQVEKLVSGYMKAMEKSGETAYDLMFRLADQTDLLIFGSKEIKEQVLSVLKDSTYPQIVDDITSSLANNQLIEFKTLENLRELSQQLRVNSIERKKVASAVKSMDRVNELVEKMDTLADTVAQLNDDKVRLDAALKDVRSVAVNDKAFAATKLAIINKNLKMMGHNTKAVRALTKIKAELEPILKKRFEGAGISFKERKKITNFLESSLFDRVRLTQNNPDFVIYATDHLDSMLESRSKLIPELRNHIADVYQAATGKPLPETTFYAHLITPNNLLRGVGGRVVEVFEKAQALKENKSGKEFSFRQSMMNSEMNDTQFSNTLGLAAAADTDKFMMDTKYTNKVASNLTQVYFNTLNDLRAFDNTSYLDIHNKTSFVYMRHMLVGTRGVDLQKFPFFGFDYETRTVTEQPAYSVLKQVVVEYAERIERGLLSKNKEISFTDETFLKIVGKHFPENTEEAFNYFRDYFGKISATNKVQVDAPTLHLAIQSAKYRKQFDVFSLEKINKEREVLNKRRDTNHTGMELRIDRVNHVMKSKHGFMDLIDTIQGQIHNQISSGKLGQIAKTLVDPENLEHPDLAVTYNTHELARKILMKDSVANLRQRGILATRTGNTLEAQKAAHLLQGQINEKVGGLRETLNTVDQKIYESPFVGKVYRVGLTTARLLGSTALSNTVGQIWNIAQATSYAVDNVKPSQKLQTLAIFPLQVLTKVGQGALRDLSSFVKDVPSHLRKFSKPEEKVFDVPTYPFELIADQIQKEGDSVSLKSFDNLSVTAMSILNNTLKETIEANNTNFVRARLEMTMLRKHETLKTPNSAVDTSILTIASIADFLTQHIKERVETAMLSTNYENAARVWQGVVNAAIEQTKTKNLQTPEQVSKYIADNWDSMTTFAGEHKADIKGFADKIANEFSKPHIERNYYNGLREFLLYSNSKMQGRFGALSNPLLINNIAQSMPAFNQFYSATTNGLYKLASLTTQNKAEGFARNTKMVQASAGILAMTLLAYQLEYGNKQIADSTTFMVDDFDDEFKRDAATSAQYSELLLQKDPKLGAALYKFLRSGTGIPFLSRMNPIGGSLSIASRLTDAKNSNQALQEMLSGPRLSGLQGGMFVALVDDVLKASQLAAIETGLADFDGTREEFEMFKRKLVASTSKKTMLSFSDLLSDPIMLYSLITDKGLYNSVVNQMVLDEAKNGNRIDKASLSKLMEVFDLEQNEFTKAANQMELWADLYVYSGIPKNAKQITEWSRRNVKFRNAYNQSLIDQTKNKNKDLLMDSVNKDKQMSHETTLKYLKDLHSSKP